MNDDMNVNNNVNNNVNSDLQKNDEDKKFLDELRREREQQQAIKQREEKRNEFYGRIKESAGDGWNELASIKNSDGKTIDDLFKEQPQLLDDTNLARSAIDLFKQIAKNSKTESVNQDGVHQGTNPARPTGGDVASGDSGEYVMPEINSPEWFRDFAAGKITKEAIMANQNLSNDAKLNLIRSIPKRPVTVPASEAVNQMM
jgi:hypothetical protein